MFSQLTYRDFRGFADLELKGLQRVNLIVGKNNAGKTSFLEGIALLSDPSRMANDLPGLLRASVGNVVTRFVRWIVRDGATREGWLHGQHGKRQLDTFLTRPDAKIEELELRQRQGVFGSEALIVYQRLHQPRIRCRVVSVQQRAPDSLVKLFGQAVKRRGVEEELEGLLREVDNRVRKVRVDVGEDNPLLMVDLGLSDMLPLTQAGQGLTRLVTIFCEILGEQPEVCLIDEIENGIHHSLLAQVWKGIDVITRRLGVQVFATTHSYECIQAAHEAFVASADYGLGIVQLFRIEGGIQGRVLDREHIEAALDGGIDLR